MRYLRETSASVLSGRVYQGAGDALGIFRTGYAVGKITFRNHYTAKKAFCQCDLNKNAGNARRKILAHRSSDRIESMQNGKGDSEQFPTA